MSQDDETLNMPEVIKGFQDALHESKQREMEMANDMLGLKNDITELKTLLAKALDMSMKGELED